MLLAARARAASRARPFPTTRRRASRRKAARPRPRRPARRGPRAGARGRRARRGRRGRRSRSRGGLAIPSPDEWEVPIRCFRCEGEYTVPFRYFRAGVVFRCPHCQGSPCRRSAWCAPCGRRIAQLPRQVGDGVRGRSTTKRRRELEQFEERQRAELERFETELRAARDAREARPGAPAKRQGVLLASERARVARAAAALRVPARASRPARRPRSCSTLVFTHAGTRSGVRHPLPRDPARARRALPLRSSVAGALDVRDHDALARPLADTEFVVVDLETTGGAPGATGIIEIGAVRVARRAAHRHVRDAREPGPPDPAVRRRPDRHHRRDGRGRAAASPRRCRASSSSPATPCWSRTTPAFDMGHLTPRSARSTGGRSTRPALCTLRLARRLMPGARAPAVARLASPARSASPASDRHRALARRAHRRRGPLRVPRAAARARRRAARRAARLPAAGARRPAVRGARAARAAADVPPLPGVYHLSATTAGSSTSARRGGCASASASYFTSARGHSSRVARPDPAHARLPRDRDGLGAGGVVARGAADPRAQAALQPAAQAPAARRVPEATRGATCRASRSRSGWAPIARSTSARFRTSRRARAGADGARRGCSGCAPARRSPSPMPPVSGQRRVHRALRGRVDGGYRAATLPASRGDAAIACSSPARRSRRLASRRPRRAARPRGARGRAGADDRRLGRHAAELRRAAADRRRATRRSSTSVLGGRLALEARITARRPICLAAVRWSASASTRYQGAPLGRERRRRHDHPRRRGCATAARRGLLLPLDGPTRSSSPARRAHRDGPRPPPARSAAADRRPRVSAARRLVVSGDDFGAAPEVNAGIVRAHRDGILDQHEPHGDGRRGRRSGRRWRARTRGSRSACISCWPRAGPRRRRATIPRAGRARTARSATAGPDRPPLRLGRRSRAGRAQLGARSRRSSPRSRAPASPLAHVDGHLNMHLHPMVLPILLELAPRYGIRAMRLSRESLGAALRYDRRHCARKCAEGAVFHALAAYAAPRLRAAGIVTDRPRLRHAPDRPRRRGVPAPR